MASKKKIVKVLIADDQTLFREGIKDVLTGEKWISVVGEAADGEEVVTLAKKLKPDVILMDIKLPKMDGITATRLIKKSMPEINILMLSSFEDEAHVMDAGKAAVHECVIADGLQPSAEGHVFQLWAGGKSFRSPIHHAAGYTPQLSA